MYIHTEVCGPETTLDSPWILSRANSKLKVKRNLSLYSTIYGIAYAHIHIAIKTFCVQDSQDTHINVIVHACCHYKPQTLLLPLPSEFLQQKWTKKNRQELAPNICYVIYRFNHMTLWVAKEIMSHDQPRKRYAVVLKMIQIARHCLELNNFVTVFQIMSALVSSSVQRLKKTWDLLPSSVSARCPFCHQL